MNNKVATIEFEGLEAFLQQKARALVTTLEQGNLASAIELINELQQARHQVFYNEVGHLTRGLHEAIKAFSSDIDEKMSSNADDSLPAMADASDRLAYVIELTEKTSHETMDRVDVSLSLVDRLDNQSERFRDLLLLVGQLEGEFKALDGVYDRTCAVKDESEKTIEQLRSVLTDILVSQSVQDITGQLIRRVITLMTQVEIQLVKLMEMAAKVERLSGFELLAGEDAEASQQSEDIAAQGPQARTKQKSAVSDQDEVDELLSSLGF
ncbi:protein phosphatase CheZ [Nitrincola tapanii]|uniref:Protein phosphatase CheZ n=1 Tax=Nitrincola tapanii TaxID=1708751 RepID=A0A5A9W9B0_9GAMM|nr:protein phosphatase CheZ [Nitrincola tapanii]KAA0876629.1 chemotaxis protein CheZ [Nitrincola tapanii]